MHTDVQRRTGRRTRSLLSIVAAAALAIPLLAIASPASAADDLPDGATSRTAAGSCWEVKQNYAASADGVYWLLTPALKAPGQFYCDMTTDGGGWVLVARGRDGWKGQYNGLSTATALRNTVDGPAAFATAQLSGRTVDQLLNNARVDSLSDGIRLRRATTQDGSQRQEVRFQMANRDRWVWTFGAEHRVSGWSFDGVAGSGGQTNNFGNDSAYRRVDASAPQPQGYVGGMAFGSEVRGSTSPNSYLWSRTENAGSARPFTQMFLRPKLTIATMDFGLIPDAGGSADVQRELPESDAIRTVWGVSGLANGIDGELNTEVAAFGQVGNTVFVGGNFRYAQRSLAATGIDKVEQPYLAGFDVSTGELMTTFRPQLNGQVKALIALPDGRLAVGGQFGQANGALSPSFVILDPVTGATSPGWQVGVENRTTGGTTQVRGFSVQGSWLYVSGSFTHWTGAGGIVASGWNGIRINLATGLPDRNWNPRLNGTSVGVDAADAGDRAYFSGYFKQSGGVSTPSGTAIQATAGAPVVDPVWRPRFSKSGVDPNGNITGNVWQLGIDEVGGRIWLGGSEHSLVSYDRTSFERSGSNITKNGGDFQTVESSGNTVFAGCHCGDYVYSNAFNWSEIGTNWTQGDKISLFGAWDATTGSYLQEFSPVVQARRGFGAWALFTDSNGNLWAGGDLSNSVRDGGVNQWSGGFMRFAPRDATAPSPPTALAGTSTGASEATLSWAAANDDRSSVRYEVVRENKVIETTSNLSTVVAIESAPVRYFLRAVDDAGNRSATTAVFTVNPPSADNLTLIENGASWSWRFDSAPLPGTWRETNFDDSAWPVGSAVLGLGSTGLSTNLAAGVSPPRPLSAQFRHVFTLTDPATVTNGQISVIADDGVIVYVNGSEVGRSNLGTGTVSQSTYATAAPRSASAGASRFVFPVSSSLLRAGGNVVSASTHANYRSTPDLSFDLTFTAERGLAPVLPAPPSAPSVTAEPLGPSSAKIEWQHGSPASVSEYRVTRDGASVGVVPAPGMSLTETGLTAQTEYTYSVVAVDSFGQVSSAGTASVTTATEEPSDIPVTLIPSGSMWSWRYDSTPLPADWNARAFDDTSWDVGLANLGFNTPGQATDISVGVPTPRPLSGQFRHAFQVGDPGLLTQASISVIANDGVVVYVNGIEVGRSNLPAGNLTQNTYATAAPRSGGSAASPFLIAVPLNLLVAGSNVVSASTHLNYRGTPDVSFDLTVSGTRR